MRVVLFLLEGRKCISTSIAHISRPIWMKFAIGDSTGYR